MNRTNSVKAGAFFWTLTNHGYRSISCLNWLISWLISWLLSWWMVDDHAVPISKSGAWFDARHYTPVTIPSRGKDWEPTTFLWGMPFMNNQGVYLIYIYNIYIYIIIYTIYHITIDYTYSIDMAKALTFIASACFSNKSSDWRSPGPGWRSRRGPLDPSVQTNQRAMAPQMPGAVEFFQSPMLHPTC